MRSDLTRRQRGVLVAGLTAAISGLSVWVNSYGVHEVRDAAVYTTAKNLVAAMVILLVIAIPTALRGRMPRPVEPSSGSRWARWAGLGYIAVIGGGLAFVWFFSGLQQTSAEPAAFLHDTLVVWVGVLAWPVLRERPSIWNVAAVGLLLAGQTIAVGGVGHLVAGRGQTLVLAATLCWAVEVVVAKRLLATVAPGTLAVVRMGGGGAVLIIYLLARGEFAALVNLSAGQFGWALLSGGLLAAYVGTWLTALVMARAVDVTSVLVASVIVTSALQALAGRAFPAAQLLGLGLVAVGASIVAFAWPRQVPA